MFKRSIVILSLFVVAAMFQSCNTPRRLFDKDVKKHGQAVPGTSEIITEAETRRLPEPVRRYLRYSGAIGRPRARVLHFGFSGLFKMKRDAGWMKVETEQYNFFGNPARTFFIKGRMNGFLPVSGRDLYEEGKGNMFISLFSMISVADVKGPEMDIGELVTFLNDMILCPTSLLSPCVEWQPVDSLTARAVIRDHGLSASGTFYFNDKGQIINFETDDRYYVPNEKEKRKLRWSTPLGNYKELGGLMVPTHGEAVWHFEDCDFTYARFDITGYEVK